MHEVRALTNLAYTTTSTTVTSKEDSLTPCMHVTGKLRLEVRRKAKAKFMHASFPLQQLAIKNHV